MTWATNWLLSTFKNFLVKFAQAVACAYSSSAFPIGICFQCLIYKTILNKVIFVQYKMVVLMFAGQKNGKTVYFDVLIPKVHFMKLFSCSFYNSWHSLKSVGQIPVEESGDMIASLSEGHYTADSLA